MLKIWATSIKKYELFALQDLQPNLSILTLAFDLKAISAIQNISCHLHTSGKYFVKYKHPPSNNVRELALQSI